MDTFCTFRDNKPRRAPLRGDREPAEEIAEALRADGGRAFDAAMDTTTDIPASCVCPITQEVMINPATTVKGKTYERAAIARWLALHDTDPLTNEVLESTTLVTNFAVKGIIDELKGKNKITPRLLTQDQFRALMAECYPDMGADAANHLYTLILPNLGADGRVTLTRGASKSTGIDKSTLEETFAWLGPAKVAAGRPPHAAMIERIYKEHYQVADKWPVICPGVYFCGLTARIPAESHIGSDTGNLVIVRMASGATVETVGRVAHCHQHLVATSRRLWKAPEDEGVEGKFARLRTAHDVVYEWDAKDQAVVEASPPTILTYRKRTTGRPEARQYAKDQTEQFIHRKALREYKRKRTGKDGDDKEMPSAGAARAAPAAPAAATRVDVEMRQGRDSGAGDIKTTTAQPALRGDLPPGERLNIEVEVHKTWQFVEDMQACVSGYIRRARNQSSETWRNTLTEAYERLRDGTANAADKQWAGLTDMALYSWETGQIFIISQRDGVNWFQRITYTECSYEKAMELFDQLNYNTVSFSALQAPTRAKTGFMDT